MRGFCLEVSGDFACFTRPEFKVERVSYPVITPSAARAIFEAILWRPAIIWKIQKIEVLKPIRWFSIVRNEVADKASVDGAGIDINKSRQQRASLILRDVKYRLHAEFEFIPPERRMKTVHPTPACLDDEDRRADETEAKYAAWFERRARKGQYFRQPYFGTREFPVDFCLVEPAELENLPPITEKAPELQGTQSLGMMLYDLDYSDPKNPTPYFYHAVMNNGVIDVEDCRQKAGVPEPLELFAKHAEKKECKR